MTKKEKHVNYRDYKKKSYRNNVNLILSVIYENKK